MRERLVLAILAGSSAVLALITSVAVAYALSQANAVSDLRQTCSLCRDSLLQCTARREQIESLFEIAATSRRKTAGMGGGP